VVPQDVRKPVNPMSLVPVPGRDIESFYSDIRKQFPELNILAVWQEAEIMNSHIMTVVAREIGNWIARGQIEEARCFMEAIESAWPKYDDQTTAFVYTDLIVTIMELPKLQRETLKSMMGAETSAQYQRLLSMYRETDV
jgi:hypothetical protein